MHKLSAMIALLLLLLPLISVACNKVAEGYESKDTMYVVCADLPNLSADDASKLVRSIIGQYKGAPDELLVYFVSSSAVVGKIDSKMTAEEFVGYYYTHNQELVIWPNSKSLRRVVELTWQ